MNIVCRAVVCSIAIAVAVPVGAPAARADNVEADLRRAENAAKRAKEAISSSGAEALARAKKDPRVPDASKLSGRFNPQAFVIVHGIGNQKYGDYEAFKKTVRAEFEREVRRLTGGKVKPDARDLHIKTAIWSDVTQKDQESFIAGSKAAGRTMDVLRKLKATLAGDTIAISGRGAKPERGKRRVRHAIRQAAALASPQETVDLNVFAHSQGTDLSQRALQEIVNADKIKGAPASERLPKNVRLLQFHTVGGIVPTSLQRTQMSQNRNTLRVPSWNHITYRGDHVGDPLIALGGPYLHRYVDGSITDIELPYSEHRSRAVRALRRLTSKVPFLSHSDYWTDPRVIKDVAHRMAHQFVGNYSRADMIAAGAQLLARPNRAARKARAEKTAWAIEKSRANFAKQHLAQLAKEADHYAKQQRGIGALRSAQPRGGVDRRQQLRQRYAGHSFGAPRCKPRSRGRR